MAAVTEDEVTPITENIIMKANRKKAIEIFQAAFRSYACFHRELPVATCASIKLGASFSLILGFASIALPLEQILNSAMFPPGRVAKATLGCFVHVRRAQLAIRSTTVKRFSRIIADDVMSTASILISLAFSRAHI